MRDELGYGLVRGLVKEIAFWLALGLLAFVVALAVAGRGCA